MTRVEFQGMKICQNPKTPRVSVSISMVTGSPKYGMTVV